jgi:hypothetical protein
MNYVIKKVSSGIVSLSRATKATRICSDDSNFKTMDVRRRKKNVRPSPFHFPSSSDQPLHTYIVPIQLQIKLPGDRLTPLPVSNYFEMFPSHR